MSATAPGQAYIGGNGGNGGDGGSVGTQGSYGGGGGGGGYGFVLTGSGTFAINYDITGGKGGLGGLGQSSYSSGFGGDGGHGLVLTDTTGVNVTINDGVTIKAGDGGYEKNNVGLNGGKGGVGILGANVNLILKPTAIITGGLEFGDPNNRERSVAVRFTGGTNTLELVGNGGTSGQTYATLNGIAYGFEDPTTYAHNDTLKFSGAGGTFDLSLVNSYDQYPAAFRQFAYVSVASGTWIMTGTYSNYADIYWNVGSGATLQLGSATASATLAGDVTVASGGTLSNGPQAVTIAQSWASAVTTGSLTVSSGGALTLQAVSGSSALTLSKGALTLSAGSTLNATLGAATTTALITVAGSLSYGGSLVIASNGSLGDGTYTLVNYGSTVTGSGFTSITGPSGYTYTTSLDTTHKLLLLNVVSPGQYWNGTTTTGSGPLAGGTGPWTAAAGGMQNWSNSGGTTHATYDPTKKAIFAGSAGTVTVDASQGAVASNGLKFTTSGYEIAGATLTLTSTSGTPQVEVVGSGTLATIGSPLAGTQGLTKIGTGTLVLTGANTYTGGTTITAGILQIGDGGTAGAVMGDIANAAALVFSRSDDFAYAGVISGTGTVEKTGAGTLTLTGSHSYSGDTTVSGGTLAFAGGSSATSGGNAVIAKDASTSGTVTVSGSGTAWNLGAGHMTVGVSGSGTLAISGGASVTNSDTVLADQSGSSGTATVTGSGSKWDLGTADLSVGKAGTGSLAVTGGGTVTSGVTYVGYNAGATGAVTVDGTGSSWILANSNPFNPATLFVGFLGSGTLTIANGGTVTSPNAEIAKGSGPGSAVTVTGSGSTWTVGNGTPYGGLLYVGEDSNGSLTVAAGATVSSTYLSVASGNTSQSALTVTGPGSHLTVTGESDLGYYGTATVTIADGGKITGGDTYIGYYGGSYLPVGSTAKVTSTATVTGTGSTWDVSAGDFYFGAYSAGTVGTLLVEKGGTVTSKGGTLGYDTGAEGLATVTGSGSSWSVGANGLSVGNGGTGSLTVADGGTVTSAADVVIGAKAGASGTMTVTGSGALLDAGVNRVVLANAATATASLTVAGGGTLAAGQIVKGNAGGTAALALDGGTLRVTAAQADYLSGFSAGEVSLRAGGGTLDTGGFDTGVRAAIGGSGGLTKIGAGTLTLTGVNTFTGTTTVSAGTLQLSGGGALAGALTAQSGTTLTGDPTGATAGSVAGAVTVADGATLAMRSGATTLTLGSLTLGSAATVATTLLAPSATAAVAVAGGLTLAGTLDLTAGTGFANGTYRLFDYGGTLTDNGLTLGARPAHSLFAVDTATAGQVNLVVAASQWWNGAGGAGVNGGSGTWDAGASANWTDATGTTTSTWSQGSLATFGGAAGTVTVAAGTAPQAVGLEFVTSGYTLAGGPVTLVPFGKDPLSRLLVDDGTAAGGTATVASALTGTQGLDKTGPGTLVLTGANTYAGGTTVSAGTLQISGGGTLAGDVAVGSGAVLTGDPAGASTGSIAGTVAVAAGGGLHLVTGTTTLSVGGALTLDPASSVAVLVLSPSSTTAARVGGNLTLAGTLDLTAGAGFGSGTYRLFDYGGTLSGPGVSLGATPAHSLFAVDTGTAGQVNLVVAAGLWWNGSTTAPGGTSVAGGTGTWDVAAGTTNWTDAAGAAANAWGQGSLAIFAGSAGTVTVGATAPRAAGMEFLTSGYTLTGGALTLVGFHNDPVTRILVDDGSAGGGSATVAAVLSGGQTLRKTGAGTLVLTAANTYAGGTTVAAGTLQIGAGGTTGSVTGAVSVASGATLVFDRSDDLVAGGAISGAGALVKRGAGTLTLAGSHGAGAGTTVAAGTLALASGAGLASDVTVQSGASLAARNAGATPTVAGLVTVQTGATLSVAAAASGPGLTTTGLVLASGSHIAVTLDAPTGTPAVSTGSLALDGVLDVATGGGLMQGVYRIIDYATLASDNGLRLGATPANFTYQIQRQPGQVNLAVSTVGTGILYWNGPQTAANGTVQGGSGTWSGDPARTNWTDASGGQSRPYQDAFTVFGGAAGRVTVDGAKGPVTTAGMQFLTDGYGVSGDAIALDDPSGLTQVRVGDGTAAGAGVTARIASVLAGPGGLVKTDLGTLVLAGANTYAGDTQVKGGTLSLTGRVDGDIYVYDRATLSGDGQVGKTVHVLDGGTLAGGPGRGLTMAGLDLAGKATLAVTLGAPGGQGVFQVNGDVTLGGTLAVTPATGFGLGVYRIANYTGSLTDHGIGVGPLPGGLLGGVQTSVAHQVNLFVDDPNSPVAFWNGSTMQPVQSVAGGSGTWKADATTNWTNASGTINRGWPSGFAVFQGPGGTVTVDNAVGAVSAVGMQFVDNGYRIEGGAITLAGSGPAPIRVGDGTAAGAATVATIASALTGTGGLEKSDFGTLILTGTNTYTGTTTIAGGTLQLGDGGTTGSVAGAIVNDARLVVARSDTYALRGQLSGTGDLEFRGGTVQYGTNAGFTGAITARDAFVRLDPGAVSASAFTLESGSTLGGTATIGGLTANAGATVAPGYSPGTITVNGAVALNAGSTYAVDVTPDGRHDLITATGPVTLSSQATVAVHATPGRYAPNSTYAILTTTATVTGRFGSVTSDYAFLKPTLSYDTRNVYLGLTYTGRRFADFARTRNQVALASAAQDLGFGDRVFEALLTLPEGQVARAFERLDGEGHASLNTVIQQQSAYLRDAVGARLRQSGSGDDALGTAARAAGPATQGVEGDPGRVLWAQAYGGFGRRQGDGNAGAIASSAGGMLAGLDVALGDAIRVGVLGGLGRSSADVPSRDTAATFATYDVGLYGSGRFGILAVRGGFAQSWNEVSARRSVVFPGYSGSQTARYTVAASQAFGEVSTDVAVGAATLQPFAGLSYVSLAGHRVREQGSPASALSGTVRGQDVTSTSVGMRAATRVSLGEVVVTPSVTLGWQHAFGDLAPRARVAFAGGRAFGVSGVPVVADAALVGAGLAYDLSDVSAIRVNYTGQLAPRATQNAFTAEYAHRF